MKDEEELEEEARRSLAETEKLREESGLADNDDHDPDEPDDSSDE
jgi:hypothetical protein